jgi:hypothetical protein
MLVAVAGAKGSPGVTSLAFALARHWFSTGGSPIFVEADPDGGAVAARLGLAEDPGLATLAAGALQGADRSPLDRHLQRLPDRPAMLLLPSAPGHARAVLRAVAETVAGLGASRPASACSFDAWSFGGPHAVADVGRLDAESASLPVVVAAASVVVVAVPTLEGADAVAVRLGELDDLRSRVQLVTVGEGPYGGEELARVLSVGYLGHLPSSAQANRSLWSGGRGPRRRSTFSRALSTMAGRLAAAGAPERPGPGRSPRPAAVKGTSA